MRVKTFFGMSLYVGALIMGSLTLALAIFCIISTSILIGQIEMNAPFSVEYVPLFKLIEVSVTTNAVVIGATGALMIHGARKRVPGFIFPWIARATADIVIMPGLVVSYIIVTPSVICVEAFFTILAIMIAVMALYIYIWLAIYSFYKQITVEKYGCAGFCDGEKVPSQPMDYVHL